MDDKESIKKIFRQMSSSFSEEEVEKYAEFMIRKNDTVKNGDDVVHFSYYSSLFDNDEIEVV